MRQNFEDMTSAELTAYALAHRDDIEPLRVLYSRRNPPDSEATWYGPMHTPEGVPIEENIRIAEEAIRKRAGMGRENNQYTRQTMTTITQEEIDQFREQLRDYPEAVAAFDVIQDWDGDLADAAESIATRNGIEGVEDNADLRWFFVMLVKIRDFTKICEPENQNFRENYLPTLIPPIADIMSSSFGCPPGVAGLLATPFAVYIKEEGIEQFCQMSLP